MIRQTAFAATLILAGCGADTTDEPAPTAPSDVVDNASAWDQAYEEAEIAKADGSSCSGILLPDQGEFGGRIALTFDDGPRGETTPEILQVLREHNAPAAFFMLGKMVDANQTLAKEIIADPNFIVAHHSWSHESLPTLGAARLEEEVDKLVNLFARMDHPTKYLRPPYGAFNCNAKALVEGRGLTVVGWHIDSADWSFDSGHGRAGWDGVPARFKTDMLGYIVNQVARYNGGVMLFHDTKHFTADHLDAVLTKLEELNYVFVDLENADAFPRLNGFEPPFIGDPCEEDLDCQFTAGGKPGYCLASTVCVTDCAGSCPDAGGKPTTFCVADPRNGVEGGICVSKAVELNNFCAAVGQVEAVEAERYVGSSGVAVTTTKVCMPVLMDQ